MEFPAIIWTRPLQHGHTIHLFTGENTDENFPFNLKSLACVLQQGKEDKCLAEEMLVVKSLEANRKKPPNPQCDKPQLFHD